MLASGPPGSGLGRATCYAPVRSPAVAEITGAGRAWTVSMISELSMPAGRSR